MQGPIEPNVKETFCTMSRDSFAPGIGENMLPLGVTPESTNASFLPLFLPGDAAGLLSWGKRGVYTEEEEEKEGDFLRIMNV